MKIQSLALLLSLGLSASTAAQGRVHVVDDDGGPGVHYTHLPDAVDAAAEGDLILVRKGSYTAPIIDGKSLTIAADTGFGEFVQLNLPTRVRNLEADDVVVLQGLRMWSTYAFIAENNQGEILLDDCELWGSGILFPPCRSALILESASVTMARCRLSGSSAAAGSHGLELRSSNVNLYSCSVKGSSKGGYEKPGTGLPGSGIYVHSGRVFAADSYITGGNGAYGAPTPNCTNGGNGGAGIETLPDVVMGTDITLLDCSVSGGDGGGAYPECQTGLPGPPTKLASGPIIELEGEAPRLTIESPVRAGEASTHTFEAQPGELAATIVSSELEPLQAPGMSGILVPSRKRASHMPAGTIPGHGTLVITRPTKLKPGSEFKLVFEQALVTPPGVAPMLGTPHVLIVLDPSF